MFDGYVMVIVALELGVMPVTFHVTNPCGNDTGGFPIVGRLDSVTFAKYENVPLSVVRLIVPVPVEDVTLAEVFGGPLTVAVSITVVM